MRILRVMATALICAAALSPAAPIPSALAGEAGDLVFADRGPWQLDGPLTWRVDRSGPQAPGFETVADGTLTLVEAADDKGQPILRLQQQSPGRERAIGPFPVSGGDPVVVFFLENTARDMAALTGGSPFYIRNRIKDAVFRGGEVIREGNRATVVLRPFESDPNSARMHGFDTLEMRFVLDGDPRRPVRELVAETSPAQPAGTPAADRPVPYRHALVLE